MTPYYARRFDTLDPRYLRSMAWKSAQLSLVVVFFHVFFAGLTVLAVKHSLILAAATFALAVVFLLIAIREMQDAIALHRMAAANEETLRQLNCRRIGQ